MTLERLIIPEFNKIWYIFIEWVAISKLSLLNPFRMRSFFFHSVVRIRGVEINTINSQDDLLLGQKTSFAVWKNMKWKLNTCSFFVIYAPNETHSNAFLFLSHLQPIGSRQMRFLLFFLPLATLLIFPVLSWVRHTNKETPFPSPPILIPPLSDRGYRLLWSVSDHSEIRALCPFPLIFSSLYPLDPSRSPLVPVTRLKNLDTFIPVEVLTFSISRDISPLWPIREQCETERSIILTFRVPIR